MEQILVLDSPAAPSVCTHVHPPSSSTLNQGDDKAARMRTAARLVTVMTRQHARRYTCQTLGRPATQRLRNEAAGSQAAPSMQRGCRDDL